MGRMGSMICLRFLCRLFRSEMGRDEVWAWSWGGKVEIAGWLAAAAAGVEGNHCFPSGMAF